MTDSLVWLETAQQRYRSVAAEPLPDNMISLLRQAAAEAGETIALHFTETGTERSYKELLSDVERLANGLCAQGVQRGSHVAVMMPNVLEMPTTWLALAAIGAVMIPINVRYTAFELHYVLTDSDASHLVIHENYAALVEQMPAPAEKLGSVIVVGDTGSTGYLSWADLVATSPAGFVPAVAPSLDDVMNIQYTSGTTGWPKGCLLTQRYWLVCSKAYSASDGLKYKRILSCNPFFYMTPQWLMLMAFFQRGTHYVAPYISLTHFTDWVRKYQIEFCWFPMDVMVHNAPRADDAPLPLLRGNLAIHRAELHAELERRYGFVARAAFGMTEIGTGLIMPIEAEEMTGSGSCGIAGPFRQARIADPTGQTVAPGKVGELLIRGPGMMQGYYKKPEATAQVFHDDWFRTGDLASQDEQGFVSIHGRIKEMIRRAGENISATEVETALLSMSGIAEVAVLPVPDPMRGEEVKAYIVLDKGRTPGNLPPEDIIAHCSERLAAFKIPRLIEYRSNPLPRSTSGKVTKPQLAAEKPDLWKDSWDRVKSEWL